MRLIPKQLDVIFTPPPPPQKQNAYAISSLQLKMKKGLFIIGN